jgi:hypothetical protein
VGRRRSVAALRSGARSRRRPHVDRIVDDDASERLRAAEYFRNAARYALDVFANEDARESATAGLELCDSAETALRTSLLDLREQSLARIGATDLRRVGAHELVALADSDEARAIALGRLFGAYATDAVGRKDALDQLALLAGTSALRAAGAFEDAGDRRAAMKAHFIGINSLTRLGSFAQGDAEVDALRPIVDASDDEVLRAEFYLVASAAQGETIENVRSRTRAGRSNSRCASAIASARHARATTWR